MAGKRVTLQDIAQATGYTINTVSRALQNKPDIGRETCLRIQQTAREMGYVRNFMASSLRSGRTRTIAMIAGSLVNPFYAILADLIQGEALRLGYSLMILSSREDPEIETQAVKMALSRQVDGVLITPCSFDSPALSLLYSSGIPFVLLSRYKESLPHDYVICNDEYGGYLAGRHLLEHGHRKLGMLSLHHVVFSTKRRFDGFQRACLEADLPVESIPYAEPETDDALRECLQRWCAAGITGLFCFSDLEAWRVIDLLTEAGVSVPENVSVIGFDNIQKYTGFANPICSIDPGLMEEARIAIDLLRNRIHNPSLPPQQVILPVSLVCRGSCGIQ